jgi:transcriptional regulator of acetoin/glycerol metabolism
MATAVQMPPLAASLGFVEARAERVDGSAEPVRLHALPVRELPAYAAALDDPAALVELCARKQRGWADTLTDDCLYALDAQARAANDPRLARLMERQAAVSERARALLPNSSPAPAAPGAAPAG